MKCPSLSSSRHGGEPFWANPFTNILAWSESTLDVPWLVTFPTSCPQHIPGWAYTQPSIHSLLTIIKLYTPPHLFLPVYYPENGFAAFGCWDSRLKGKRRFIENWSLKINSLNSIKNCVLVKWLKSIIMLGPENEKCNPKMLIFFFFPTFLSNQTEH